MKLTRLLGLAGLLGGIAQLALEFSVGDWGTPGTLAYTIYELTNRLMALALLLMALGFVGVYRAQRGPSGRLGRVGFGLVCAGWIMMSLGNALEFYVFTDLPYGTLNARAWSWIGVLVGWLVMLIGAALWGWAARRAQSLPGWVAVALLALLPIEIILFFWLYLLLPATAALSVAMGAWLVLTGGLHHEGAKTLSSTKAA